MSAGRVRYRVWALRVLAWDALLPVCVTFLPLAIKGLFPNQRGALELTAVILPIAAFFARFRAGRRHIRANLCASRVQRFQLVVFCLGILPLVLIDCAVILSELMPAGAFAAADYMALGIAVSFYLTAMIIAMYPGRENVSLHAWDYTDLLEDDGTANGDMAHSSVS